MGRGKNAVQATTTSRRATPADAYDVIVSSTINTNATRYSRKELEAMADRLEDDAPTTPLEELLAVGTTVALAEEPEITGLVLRAHRMRVNWIQYRVRWLEGTEGLQGDETWGDYSRSDLVVVR
jgi:hypothetical protein